MRAAALLSSGRAMSAISRPLCSSTSRAAAVASTSLRCSLPARASAAPLPGQQQQQQQQQQQRRQQQLRGGSTFCAAAAVEAARTASGPPPAPPRSAVITDDPANNVTDYIYSKMGINLHHQPDHPIGIIKQTIQSFFESQYPNTFTCFDDLYPVVSTKANFDEVLVPADHVSRSSNDTYYVSSDTVLRCHTSAHQAEMLRRGEGAFLLTGEPWWVGVANSATD